MTDARERFLAFRRAQANAPALTPLTVQARGLPFHVRLSPPVPGTRPLLCINGGLLFSHQLLWPTLAPLAKQRQLVFYDQRGRGATPAPPGLRAARIEHDALDVPALREALGIAQWDVLGHSWGGGIALLAASEDPRGTSSLTLLNAVGPTSRWLPPLHERGVARLPDPLRDALASVDVTRLTEPDPAFHWEYHRLFYPAWFSDLALGRLLAPPRAESLTGATIAAKLRREGYDWTDRLRGLDVPALLLHGTDDLIPTTEADATAALLARAQRVDIPGAGHLPFFEQPEPTFAAVQDFLARGGT
jgi:proline iminopeptidase